MPPRMAVIPSRRPSLCSDNITKCMPPFLTNTITYSACHEYPPIIPRSNNHKAKAAKAPTTPRTPTPTPPPPVLTAAFPLAVAVPVTVARAEETILLAADTSEPVALSLAASQILGARDWTSFNHSLALLLHPRVSGGRRTADLGTRTTRTEEDARTDGLDER